MRPTLPPALGTKLLVAFVPERTAEALCGDLVEQYRHGRSRAWFWEQVLVALLVSVKQEVQSRTLHAIRGFVVGYSVAAVLCYYTTSLAATFVRSNTAYLLFLPLVFFSAAASGWVVQRSHSKPMVLVYAGACVVAAGVIFAAYSWLPIFEARPVPVLAFFIAADFIVGPAGVIVGGLWESSEAKKASA